MPLRITPVDEREAVHTMLKQAKEVLGWYGNRQNLIPAWYFKGLSEEWN